MASQRHKREHRFQLTGNTGTLPDELTGPKLPEDASNDTATEYAEQPAWPDADRETVIPT